MDLLQTGSPLRVLVVEDDVDTRNNLCDILQLDGYATETAGSVAETLTDRDWTTLFAIILDRKLPDGAADTFLPQLRELAPKAAIIVVTGYADLEGAIGVIRHGIADFIPKPVDPDMLRASLARTVRLREMEEQTRQDERLATIGRMMASVAHESRGALQRIRASTDLLELTLENDPDGLHDVASIRTAAGNLESLLDEIRGYAAPIQLRRERCRIDRVWLTAWDHLPHTPARAGASLQIDTRIAEPVCVIDPLRIEQVFRNLFENSIAASRGSCHITLGCEGIVSGGRRMLRIRIADDGPGLTADQRHHLFEPFYTTKPEGTGLGLPIIQRIVDAHGGRIRLEDPAATGADGACFQIDLPCPDDTTYDIPPQKISD